jgi:hypothetical protein
MSRSADQWLRYCVAGRRPRLARHGRPRLGGPVWRSVCPTRRHYASHVVPDSTLNGLPTMFTLPSNCGLVYVDVTGLKPEPWFRVDLIYRPGVAGCGSRYQLVFQASRISRTQAIDPQHNAWCNFLGILGGCANSATRLTIRNSPFLSATSVWLCSAGVERSLCAPCQDDGAKAYSS